MEESDGDTGPVHVTPRVDNNKDLHILMKKTPQHLGRGLREAKNKKKKKQEEEERRRGEGGVGFIRYQFSWYSSGIC